MSPRRSSGWRASSSITYRSPGVERVVALRPGEGARIGRHQPLAVIYDQPIALTTARSLVTLTDRQGRAVPFELGHPLADRFEGLAVDRRLVALIRPARPLEPGESLRLSALDRTRTFAARPRERVVTVAEPLRHLEVTCAPWSRGEEICESSAGRLRTAGRQIYVRFNNAIATDAERLRQHVALSPPVRNLALRALSWEDSWLVVRGDFRPSTTYRLRVSGLRDRFGQRQRGRVDVEVQVLPLGASVAMPEGMLVLDAETSRRFPITSRNVVRAELGLWPVQGGEAQAFREALTRTRGATVGGEPLVRIEVPIVASRDRFVETEVDLTASLAPGASYVATVRPRRRAFGAPPVRHGRGAEASRPPVALLRVDDGQGLAVHAHRVADALLVHVAQAQTGAPVGGAEVSLLGGRSASSRRTDANGLALLRGVAPDGAVPLLQVVGSGSPLIVPATGEQGQAAELFPELSGGGDAGPGLHRALLFTDRGIYRPGATVRVKTSLFRSEGAGLRPEVARLLRLELLGPRQQVVADRALLSGPLGGAMMDLELPATADLGRYQLRVEPFEGSDEPLARVSLRVAAFVPPRFAVDVAPDPAAGAGRLVATVHGRYLFGAPMNGAAVEWTLRRSEAPIPAGALRDGGLIFRRIPRWFEEASEPGWSRTGEGELSPEGLLRLDQPVPLPADGGPQRLVLEAEVADRSHRRIAGRATVIQHPASRYAGLRGPRGWVDVAEPVAVELGVIDRQGSAVVGARATARLHRVSWRMRQQRVAGGALRRRYTAVRTEVGRCTVRTERRPVPCRLRAPNTGDYEVTAEVDGRAGGRIAFFAWHSGDREPAAVPSRGPVVELSADRTSYAPGQTAQVLVRSPYPEATAVVTTEAGRLLDYRAVRVTGGAARLSVPIRPEHAPHVHVTVTLLPIGAEGEARLSHRIGALRLPVSLEHAALQVAVSTDRAAYEPGDEAAVTVTVRRGGKPQPGVEVALYAVDEGVLRLTGYRAPEPAAELHPGRPLDFALSDTRRPLADLLEQSHVAGGGLGEQALGSQARRDFVETALWRPMLWTDAAGQVRVPLPLPDNLTEFRVMAVAVDGRGRGGRAERAIQVRKPVLLTAELPRFVRRGDRFAAAAMVHNDDAVPFHGIVRLGEREQPISLGPGDRGRVAFELRADRLSPLELQLSVADGRGVRDAVVRRIPVVPPGLEHRPRLRGVFQGEQRIALRLPSKLLAAEDGALVVKVGQHLWPELGARLEYLLDYPHGCVEQTTSSTLPLIAAREILPRIGLRRVSDEFLNVRIRAGLERLASMRTDAGGLGYWPGASEPNVYGTAYAVRAVVRAERIGVAPPAGLREAMIRYLAAQLRHAELEPEVRAAIAQSLAEVGELDAGVADPLFDRAGGTSVFGQASLALALSGLPNQQDRVEQLLDRVERARSPTGELLEPPGRDDFSYFGSATRTKAQAAMALGRLRPGSPRLGGLLAGLARASDVGYTTQAAAFSLLALSDHLRRIDAAGADVRVALDGEPLGESADLGHGSRLYRSPLAELQGKERTLSLTGDGGHAIAYRLEARYGLDTDEPPAEPSLAASRGPRGVDLYRIYTDADGRPIDRSRVPAGAVVRVALLARLPADLPRNRRGFLAITDRLPAGLEPIDPDLETTARAAEVGGGHLWAALLGSSGDRPDHVALGDDTVKIYFDHPYGEQVGATYLARATTEGAFAAAPAAAELMYEPGSVSYSAADQLVVR